MIVFSCNNLSFSFGEKEIFSDVSITINEKDKIGIVGGNGQGKTTLIKILTGEYYTAANEVIRCSRMNSDFLGYLPQNSDLDSDNSVINEFMLPFSELIDIEKRIEKLESDLALNDNNRQEISQKIAILYEEYVNKGGNVYKSRVSSILKGLGFDDSRWNIRINDLSGGQKTRLALGRIFLKNYPLLILDEPTNHLDIDSINWLESELKSYKGTLLVISHDRCFLDNITEKTMLVDGGDVKIYNAPYSKYQTLRDNDIAYIDKCYKQQQKEIARINAFIEKQRQWNRERNIIAAESRLKQLEKMTVIEKYKDSTVRSDIHFDIDIPGGNEVLNVNDLCFNFTDSVLFEHVTFNVRKGERVFITGPNGCGKSTFLKVITNTLSPDMKSKSVVRGNFKIGANTGFSYYSQDLSGLNNENNIFDEVYDYANIGLSYVNMVSPLRIRNALASFGFKGDDVFKIIGTLSGGERSRLSLLKLTFAKNPLLILDEPTNHLDIETREILEKALLDFEGTLIAVSHDRYFSDKLATRKIDFSEFNIKKYEEVKKDKSDVYKTERQERANRRKLENDIKKLELELESVEKEYNDTEAQISNNDNGSDYILLAKLCEKRDNLAHRGELIFQKLNELYELQKEKC